MERILHGLEYIANLRRLRKEESPDLPEVIHPHQVLRRGRIRWTRRNGITMGAIGLTAAVAGFLVRKFIRKDKEF